jgi:D-sedoheptulose 7-phosphate isomerase
MPVTGHSRVSEAGTESPGVGDHVGRLARALRDNQAALGRVDAWGQRVAAVLLGGGRLLAAGNGGSAAQAQHLTAELVGRYLDERRPFSAIALHAETSSLTALCNDYGAEQAFARAVRAHGRPGDVLVALSTSGRSPNLLAAVAAAHELGLSVLALTGPAPNPLAGLCPEAVAIEAERTATVQEVHLVAVHLLCASVDRAVAASPGG